MVQNSGYCSKKWGETYIQCQMLCAAPKKGQSIGGQCIGDEGSLLITTSGNGKQVVIGIMSFSEKCGQAGRSQVFMNIKYYLKWINNYIGHVSKS